MPTRYLSVVLPLLPTDRLHGAPGGVTSSRFRARAG